MAVEPHADSSVTAPASPAAKAAEQSMFRQAMRFLAVGILNTAFGYLVYAIGILAGAPAALALGIAIVCGATFNFFTTGRLVFGGASASAVPRFALAYGLVYLLNLALLSFAQQQGLGPLAGQAVALPPTVVITFVAMKYVVFRR